MAVTLTQIRAFLAVRNAGSVHGAASQLLVSQPSVSAAVASLGRELGVALFERHGRGVRLTEPGEAFAPYAAQLLGLLEQGRSAAAEAAHPETSKVRLAAVNTAGEYLIPPLILACRELHPGINILLEVGNRATVFERLESRRADIGIGGRPPGRGLVGYPLVGNELVVVARDVVAFARGRVGDQAGHRAAARRPEPRAGRVGRTGVAHPRVERRDQAGPGRRPWRHADLAVRGRARAAGGAAVRDRGARHAAQPPVARPVRAVRAGAAGGPGARGVPALDAGTQRHRETSMTHRKIWPFLYARASVRFEACSKQESASTGRPTGLPVTSRARPRCWPRSG